MFTRRGIFDIHLVWNLYSHYIEHYWPLLSSTFSELRTVENDDSYFEHAAWLHARCCTISKKRKGQPIKTDTQLQNFIAGELAYARRRKSVVSADQSATPSEA